MDRIKRHPFLWSFFFAILIASTCLWIYRFDILRGVGWYLVAEDPLEKSDLFVILGGNSAERGWAACTVDQQLPSCLFVCTGGNEPSQLAAIGIHTYEAELTKNKMIRCGIDSTRITSLNIGTSSQEEAEAILSYSQLHQLKKITIISGQYHLRRLRMTYDRIFANTGIEVRLYGAKEKDFDPDQWWTSESGLIYTNNEYIKFLYYWWKY
jgi:uncharacterized SAM-binding protein YcdF (DUF218 family)